MKKSLIEIYALAVCFVAITCLAVALGIGLYDLVQIGAPEITVSAYVHEAHQSNEAFRTSRQWQKDMAALPEEQVTKRRQDSYLSALAAERRDGWQSLLRMAIIMLVDAVFFAVHWRLAKRIRESTVGV